MVCQGSILDDLLFSIYIQQLKQEVHKYNVDFNYLDNVQSVQPFSRAAM